MSYSNDWITRPGYDRLFWKTLLLLPEIDMGTYVVGDRITPKNSRTLYQSHWFSNLKLIKFKYLGVHWYCNLVEICRTSDFWDTKQPRGERVNLVDGTPTYSVPLPVWEVSLKNGTWPKVTDDLLRITLHESFTCTRMWIN